MFIAYPLQSHMAHSPQLQSQSVFACLVVVRERQSDSQEATVQIPMFLECVHNRLCLLRKGAGVLLDAGEYTIHSRLRGVIVSG
jgi:hypothetical protein